MEELDKLIELAEKSNARPYWEEMLFKHDVEEWLGEINKIEVFLSKLNVRLGILKSTINSKLNFKLPSFPKMTGGDYCRPEGEYPKKEPDTRIPTITCTSNVPLSVIQEIYKAIEPNLIEQ